MCVKRQSSGGRLVCYDIRARKQKAKCDCVFLMTDASANGGLDGENCRVD